MQRKVIASAAALGVMASIISAPVVDAAEIGPRAGNQCSVKLNQEEKDYLAETNKPINNTNLMDAYAKGIEGAFPQIKSWADSTLSNPQVVSGLKKFDSGREGDITIAEEDALEDAIDKIYEYDEMGNYIGRVYAWARLAEKYPRVVDELTYGAAVQPMEKVAVTAVVASNQSLAEVNFGAEIAKTLHIPSGRVDGFISGINGSKLGKVLNAVQDEYNPAVEKAMAACAQGGNATVAYPTKGYASTFFNIPEENIPEENAGKIIGIIAGVLAAIGLLFAGFVAVAPQLGIALPFELPQLPY